MISGERGAAGWRRWFGLYLAAVGVVSTGYGVLLARRAGGWAIGDWAINYSAGFVRRGLTGEVVLLLGRGLGVGLPGMVSLPWIVFAMQETAYLIFLGCVYRLTRGVRWSWMLAAVLLSPATLAFGVLDPPNGFKKEVLLFAALAGLICAPRLGRLRDRQAGNRQAGNRQAGNWQAGNWQIGDWKMGALLSVGCVGLVLSHEALLFYLPYLFAAVAVRVGLRRALRMAVGPVLGCGAAGMAVLRHPGDRRMAETICASVGGRWSGFGVPDDGICGGAIVWLQESFAQAHAAVAAAIPAHHLFRLYGVPAGLALLPAVAALGRLYRDSRAGGAGSRREVKVVAACSMISLAGSLVLFYGGRDWGRWIHIHAVCLMLLVLMLSRGEDAAPERVRWGGARRWVAVGALAVYATCWTLPAVDIYPARSGYFGLYRYLRGYGRMHSQDQGSIRL